jgi:hypothetical protein
MQKKMSIGWILYFVFLITGGVTAIVFHYLAWKIGKKNDETIDRVIKTMQKMNQKLKEETIDSGRLPENQKSTES